MALGHRWVAATTVLATVWFVASVTPGSRSASATKPSQKTEEKAENILANAVRHQLQELPYYSVFDYLGFSLSGDKVTLTGQVQRPTLKAHAEAAVKSLEGVATVVNNIEVLPASPNDHELRRNVYRAIFEDSILQKYAVQALPSIHIIVKNGAVSLEGRVDSDADKALAGNLVNKVPNVAGLRNNLIVRKTDNSAK
jgi:hyperosmotically inducible protein